MFYTTIKNAWGYGIVAIKKDYSELLYVRTIHKDNTCELTTDYSLAKRWKDLRTARKHLDNLNSGN